MSITRSRPRASSAVMAGSCSFAQGQGEHNKKTRRPLLGGGLRVLFLRVSADAARG